MQLSMQITESTDHSGAICTRTITDGDDVVYHSATVIDIRYAGRWVQEAMQIFEGIAGVDIVPPYPPHIEFNLDTDPIVERSLGVKVAKADVVDVDPALRALRQERPTERREP